MEVIIIAVLLLLGLMIIGFIRITLQNLSLRFRVWQMERIFDLMTTAPPNSGQNNSGGGFGFYIVIFFILLLAFIWLLLGG